MLKSFNDNKEFLPISSLARGFTLLELLVVVALLALLASVALVAMDRTGTEARDDLARIEMNEIRKALRMFYRDVGHFPDALSGVVAEDLRVSMLLSCDEASDVGCTAWNPDTKRGWNGPYITAEAIDDPWYCEPDGTGPCVETENHQYHLLNPENDGPNDTPPVRLISFGPNGVNNSAPGCIPGGDDIVICLLK